MGTIPCQYDSVAAKSTRCFHRQNPWFAAASELSGAQHGRWGVIRPLVGVGHPLPGMVHPRRGVNRSLLGLVDPAPGVGRPLLGANHPLQGVTRPLPGVHHPLQGAIRPLPGASAPLCENWGFVREAAPGTAAVRGWRTSVGHRGRSQHCQGG